VKVEGVIRSVPIADRVRDDFGVAGLRVHFDVDPVRAALAGVSNAEVAQADLAALSGAPLNTLREGDKRIPIVARLRMEERGNLGDLDDLYVYSTRSSQKIPIAQVATRRFSAVPEKIQRRNQLRTISVAAFPVPGKLPSEVMKLVHPKLQAIRESLPPGYFMEIGGSEEEVGKVAREAAVGLLLATGITLLLVPLLYAVFVLDLKWLTWNKAPGPVAEASPPTASVPAVISVHGGH